MPDLSPQSPLCLPVSSLSHHNAAHRKVTGNTILCLITSKWIISFPLCPFSTPSFHITVVHHYGRGSVIRLWCLCSVPVFASNAVNYSFMALSALIFINAFDVKSKTELLLLGEVCGEIVHMRNIAYLFYTLRSRLWAVFSSSMCVHNMQDVCVPVLLCLVCVCTGPAAGETCYW